MCTPMHVDAVAPFRILFLLYFHQLLAHLSENFVLSLRGASVDAKANGVTSNTVKRYVFFCWFGVSRETAALFDCANIARCQF